MSARLGDAVRLGDYAPGTPEWETARATRVGGSEIAALLGLSPWESWFSLYHRKRGTIPAVEETEHMWWGLHIEQVIADRFALAHPEWDVRRIGTFVNRERDEQLISPDRQLVQVGGGRWELLEIKHPYNDGTGLLLEDGTIVPEWGDHGSDQIPVHYRCQLQWAMDCFGIERHRMAVYFGGGDYREYVMRYDADEARVLRKRAAEFVAAVRDGIEPTIDEHTATYRAVRDLHPDIVSGPAGDVELPEQMARDYLHALDLEDDARALKTRCTAEVADYLGDARRAIHGVNAKGQPRAIACRVPGRDGAAPYLRANPRPRTKKEIG